MPDENEVQLELVETITPTDAPAAVSNPQPDDAEAPAVMQSMSYDYITGFNAGLRAAYALIAASDPYTARPILDLKPN